ncbi:MAG TPA: PaaI family thioesterase [Acidimicrobiales bacterium]
MAEQQAGVDASTYTSQGWEAAMAIVYDERTPARVTAHVDIDERHHQPYGIVHGGVWASIVESVASHGAALAAMEIDGVAGVVGVSNLTDFLRSHQRGRVDAIASPVFVGRSQQLWAVEISRERDGKLVARGQVRFQNLTQLPAERRGR